MSGIRVTYSGLISLVLGLVSVLVGLLFTLVVTRTLDPKEYGTWSLIGGLVAYASIIEPMISNWATRESARGIKSEKTAIYSSILFSGAGAVIYLIAGLVIGNKVDAEQSAVVFGSILIPPIFLNRIFTAITIGWKPHVSSYGQLSFAITEIALGFVLVHFMHLKIYGVIITVMISYLASIFILWGYAREKIKGNLKKEFLKKWLKLSWLQVYQTLGNIVPSFDVTIFSILTGSVVGLAFWSAASVMTNFVKSSTPLILAANSKLLQGGNSEYLRETLTQFSFFTILFASVTITFAKQGLFMLNPLYTVSSQVVIIMSVQASLSNLAAAIVVLITGVEKVDMNEKASFRDFLKSKLTFSSTFFLVQALVYITMLIIGLKLFLTPAVSRTDLLVYWSIIALVSQIPFTIYSITLLRKHLGIAPDAISIIKYLLASGLSFGLAYVLMSRFLDYNNNVFYFFPHLALFMGIGIGSYLAITYFIDKRTRALFGAIINEFLP